MQQRRSQARELLTRCWPHIVALAPKDKALDSFFCELLQLFLDAQGPADIPLTTFQQLVKKHHIRRVQPEQILEILQQSPLRVAPATTEATSAHIKLMGVDLIFTMVSTTYRHTIAGM